MHPLELPSVLKHIQDVRMLVPAVADATPQAKEFSGDVREENPFEDAFLTRQGVRLYVHHTGEV